MFAKKSTPPSASKCVREWDGTLAQKGWWHSFELPDGRIIDGVCDVKGLKNRLAQFPIPENLEGKRVLDIGAWDGWFSFEMERRGAEVTAVDNWDNERFRYIRQELGSRVDYRILDVYELDPFRLGRFDIVLFLGVLYHLKHPLLALEKVCALTDGLAAVDSFVVTETYKRKGRAGDLPAMEFYEVDELGGQFDNWVGPNVECLLAFCRTAGFARVKLQSMLRHSACVACYRRWEALSAPRHAPPQLIKVEHNANRGINFHRASDGYVSCWFTTDEEPLTREGVMPEVDGYGSPVVFLAHQAGGEWQINFKLPPGIEAGWREVRLRTATSGFSNVMRIPVDVPAKPTALTITGVCDGGTWMPNQLQLGEGAVISMWVTGLPENADRNNVGVWVGGMRLGIEYIAAPEGDKARQMNVRAPLGAKGGEYWLVVTMGDVSSRPAGIKFLAAD
jgi:tRNA (mo5U34)-methyltransferase